MTSNVAQHNSMWIAPGSKVNLDQSIYNKYENKYLWAFNSRFLKSWVVTGSIKT